MLSNSDLLKLISLKISDAEILTATKQLADFYEAVEKIANTESADYSELGDWRLYGRTKSGCFGNRRCKTIRC